jgi:putative transposase
MLAIGEVITQYNPRHRHQEFSGFLRQIEKSVPEGLDVLLIVDNYCTHKQQLSGDSEN